MGPIYWVSCTGTSQRNSLFAVECSPPIEVIRATTSYAAEMIVLVGKIGAVDKGGFADLIVGDGDPLADLSLLSGQGQHMPVIMKGTFVKNELND